MKKVFFLAIVALAAVSCSNDKAVEINHGDAISFKPLGTKATETTTGNIKNFNVFAYYDNGITPKVWADLNSYYMNGYEVSRTNSAAPEETPDWSDWTYSPVKYWPTEGLLHFFAYSPYDSDNATFSAADGAPTVEYTVGTTVALQEDFIVANALDQKRWNETGTKTPVNLTFAHALSQIIFKARSIEQGVIFNISKIEIVNVNSSGTFDLTTTIPASTTGWSYPNPLLATYEATLTAAAAAIGYHATDYTAVTGTDAILMLLPQTLTLGSTAGIVDPTDDVELTAAGGSFLRITYTATDPDTGAPIATTKTKLIGLSGTWERGKRYIYQLALSGSQLDPIVFDLITVEGWTDATPSTPSGL